MRDHKVIMSCERVEEHKHRAARMYMVLGFAVALAESNGITGMQNRIHRMNDHKGLLEVYWSNSIPSAMARYMKMAWESSVGDGGGPIRHHVCDCESGHWEAIEEEV